MPASLAVIEHAPLGEERVVALRGEIDVGTTPALRDWLGRASDGGRRSVAVDLTNVDFMAVSGLYVLCDEQARLARREARLTLIGPSPRIERLFEACRLGDVVHVVASRDELSPAGMWDPGDDERSARLDAWLERYASPA